MSKKSILNLHFDSYYKEYVYLNGGLPVAELDIEYTSTELFIRVEMSTDEGPQRASIGLTIEQTNELIDKLIRHRDTLNTKEHNNG